MEGLICYAKKVRLYISGNQAIKGLCPGERQGQICILKRSHRENTGQGDWRGDRKQIKGTQNRGKIVAHIQGINDGGLGRAVGIGFTKWETAFSQPLECRYLGYEWSELSSSYCTIPVKRFFVFVCVWFHLFFFVSHMSTKYTTMGKVFCISGPQEINHKIREA